MSDGKDMVAKCQLYNRFHEVDDLNRRPLVACYPNVVLRIDVVITDPCKILFLHSIVLRFPLQKDPAVEKFLHFLVINNNSIGLRIGIVKSSCVGR